MFFPIRVRAEETGEIRESQAPHLIQTVTERDIFEGLLALGLLEAPVLEESDCALSYENVKNCIVRIHMGNAYGSGVVFRITPEHIIIVTNKHVLSYWEETISFVQFPQGCFTEAEVLGVVQEHDIGFLAVDNREFDYQELESLQYSLGYGAVSGNAGRRRNFLYGCGRRSGSGQLISGQCRRHELLYR